MTHWYRIALTLLGIGLVVLAVLGLVLPMIPGIPLLLVAVLVMSRATASRARGHRLEILQLRFWQLLRAGLTGLRRLGLR